MTGEASAAENDDNALRWTRAAVAILSASSGDRTRTRFDEAVQLLRDAVAATPDTSPDLAGRLSNLSGALQLIYAQFGIADDLDESVARGRQSLDRTAEGDEHAPSHASNLAAALRHRFDLSGDLSDLEESIQTGQLAVSWSRDSDNRLPGRLSNLCSALRTHWERAGDVESLRAALRAGQRASALTAAADPPHPLRASVTSNLSSVLDDCYQFAGDQSDLRTAITLGEECLTLTRDGDPDAAARLSNMSRMLRDLYTVTGSPGHLERAVAFGRQAVASDGAERNRAALLTGLSSVLLARYEASRREDDLAEAVAAAREAQATSSPGQADWPLILLQLSAALQIQASAVGEAAPLDQAIDLAGQAITALPGGHPRLGALHNNLSIALWRRFEETGHPDDIERAVTAADTAVTLTRDRHQDGSTAAALTNLSAALQARYEFSQHPADLRGAVEAAQQALELGRADSPRRASWEATTANALRMQFEASRDPALLDEAVALARSAVDTSPKDSAEHGIQLNTLALPLMARAELRSSERDADVAVKCLRDALTMLDTANPVNVAVTANLALALLTRYELSGLSPDLDESARHGWDVAERTGVGHPDRARYLSNHGITLKFRFEATGNSADLDAAVEVLREAVDVTSPADARRSGRWGNLSSALRARSRLLGAPADAVEAVAAARAAVGYTPAGHTDRPGNLMTLALALQAEADMDSASPRELLAEAEQVLADAVASTSPGSAGRLDWMSNQAGLLMRLFDHTDDGKLLDKAIGVIRRVVRDTPADHPGLASYESNLGRALFIRYEQTGAVRDRKAAQTAFQSAAGRTASPAVRADAARGWATAAAAGSDWPATVQASEQAIAMIAQVGRGLARADQERRLRVSQGTASRAAASCLQAGDLARAIELLEQGRGVMLSQAVEMRSDITRLADANNHLADRFAAVRSRLDVPLPEVTIATGPGDRARALARAQERRQAAALEFEDVIEEIRRRPGFERFLLAPELPDLRAAAVGGPVVVINVDSIRCDALIVSRNRALHAELPGLTPETARQQAVKLMDAVGTAVDPVESASGRRKAEAAIAEVLGWLWDDVAEPVFRKLDESGLWREYGRTRRLWWCPTGALAYLPLHAAGRPGGHAEAASPSSVLDEVVSSYTPTIRALLDSRGLLAPDLAGPPQITAVAMPRTPGQMQLPNATAEARMLEAAFPGQVQVLTGQHAIRKRVLAALAERPWAHLACHGVTDIERPSESALLVHDYQKHPLTVADVVRLRLPAAELAYLSACDTAQPSAHLLDESVHLASAFQAAGYRHVIATMWPVWDAAALQAAQSVYTVLAQTGLASDAARAVHTAVRAARDRAPNAPSAWASLVHYGP